MRAFESEPRRQQELAMRPHVNRVYDYVWPGCSYRRFDDQENILDRLYGVDVEVTLPNGMIMLGQEKALSQKYRHKETVTVEYYNDPATKAKGDWFHLAVQFYLCGYASADLSTITPWMLLNWPSVVEATLDGSIDWWEQGNNHSNARANFKYVRMADIPEDCIIAKFGRFRFAKRG